jgi:hypothetical protein
MRARNHPATQSEEVATAGELFSDGTVIELIRDTGPNGKFRLLHWSGSSGTAHERCTVDGNVYVPLALDPPIARALVLPNGTRPYGSTGRLFKEISSLVSRVTLLPENVVTPFAFYVLATWLFEFLPAAPCLWITVPPTTSTSALLQIISLLCRRALFLTEPAVAAFRLIPTQLKPTIVTEVSIITRPLLQLLRTSSRRGFLSASGGKWADPFCAKIVVSRQALRDPESAGFPLEIVLPPSGEYIPRLDAFEADRIASEFQPKLLEYRLMNRLEIKKPKFEVRDFSAPMQELAYDLGACVVGDDRLQRQILAHLEKDDREIQVNRSGLLESIVIEALLAACHDPKVSNVSVTDLTRSVNTILAARGDAREVSPENVGWKLRHIGLRTVPVTGGCKGLALPNEIRSEIHALAAGYGVRALYHGTGEGKCPECKAVQNEKKAG